MLENVEYQIFEGTKLVLNAYDKDIVASDLLGVANPIDLVDFCQDDKKNFYDVDLFYKFKKTGNIKFQTEFVWKQPDPPPNPKLNSNCRLEVIIKSASFLKDADWIGKQDPYIKFKYDNKYGQTEVKDGAGTHATWNEKFCLNGVEKPILAGYKLAFESYDKDVASSDWLGSTTPISLVTLVQDEEAHIHNLTLFDGDKKKSGELEIETKFIYVAPEPEPNDMLNRNCALCITLGKATFYKDNDTFGKQDPFIQFLYEDEYVKSKVIEGGGLKVEFNQTLELHNIFK